MKANPTSHLPSRRALPPRGLGCRASLPSAPPPAGEAAREFMPALGARYRTCAHRPEIAGWGGVFLGFFSEKSLAGRERVWESLEVAHTPASPSLGYYCSPLHQRRNER